MQHILVECLGACSDFEQGVANRVLVLLEDKFCDFLDVMLDAALPIRVRNAIRPEGEGLGKIVGGE